LQKPKTGGKSWKKEGGAGKSTQRPGNRVYNHLGFGWGWTRPKKELIWRCSGRTGQPKVGREAGDGEASGKGGVGETTSQEREIENRIKVIVGKSFCSD